LSEKGPSIRPSKKINSRFSQAVGSSVFSMYYPVIPCHHFKDKKIIIARTDKPFFKIYYEEVVKN